jgi:hypothetical protein
MEDDVRPSYVLGGHGMEVVHDKETLEQYVAAAVGVIPERPKPKALLRTGRGRAVFAPYKTIMGIFIRDGYSI